MDKNSIVSVSEMRLLDELTLEAKGLTSFELMSHVGKSIYNELSIKDVNKKDNILIVSGYGNNGGDGIIAGRNFIQEGYKVSFALIGSEKGATFETKLSIDDLKKLNVKILKVKDNNDLKEFNNILVNSALIIDAIFGIGLSRDIEGIYYNVIQELNQGNKPIYSIDIPSGISAESGIVKGIAVHATKTIIIQHYKYGNLLHDAADFHGESIVLDVGISDPEVNNNLKLLEITDVYNQMPKRVKNSNKYNYGSVLTVGGSKGMMGAPVMAAYAALKTGSGLSSIAVNEINTQYRIDNYPELMECFYQDTINFKGCLSKKSIVIFGPGLGRKNDLNKELLKYLLKSNIPLVIDADGLFYFKEYLKDNETYPQVVITPHLGELAMLLGKETKEVINDSLKDILKLSNTYDITVVLKGYCTLISDKDITYFSRNGNPGMATAGSGDVLSGIIGSLIGQGYSLIESAKLGVLLHSIAGQKACEIFGEEYMSALDIIKSVSDVLKLMKVK